MASNLFCVDCKHHDKTAVGVHICVRRSRGVSLVTGKTIRMELNCEEQRSKSVADFCGPEGRYFEQKDKE